MKISEMFTRVLQDAGSALLRSAPSALAAAVSTSTPLTALVTASSLNDRTGLETKLPFGHNGLPGLQSLLDHDFFVHTLAGRDRTLLDG
jgi:hypothetical protein